MPAPLIAMVTATLLQAVFKFDGVATIGSAFGGIPQSLPAFQPLVISFTDIVKLIGPAFTIALPGAIESLLSAVVADGMTGTRHDSNQELIGQGVANIVSPLFGGFAATGAIARTATNIRNGGTSPLAGITHAVFLLITFVLTVFADLVIAVNVGVVLASLLFMRRMAQSVQVVADSSDGVTGANGDLPLPAHTLVYRIDGPFFFGAAENWSTRWKTSRRI